jgi:hypothetical protein
MLFYYIILLLNIYSLQQRTEQPGGTVLVARIGHAIDGKTTTLNKCNGLTFFQ